MAYVILSDNIRAIPYEYINPAVQQLTNWWFQRWGISETCDRIELDTSAIYPLRGFISEVIVLKRGEDFYFSRWGDRWTEFFGKDLNASKLSALPQKFDLNLTSICEMATKSQWPAGLSGEWIAGGKRWNYEVRALPVASKNGTATRLVLALIFGFRTRKELEIKHPNRSTDHRSPGHKNSTVARLSSFISP